MKNIVFWVNFVAENSNKLQKLGWKEKAGEPSMCSHCRIKKISILKMWKMKNVFTLGPTAHATLVYIIIQHYIISWSCQFWAILSLSLGLIMRSQFATIFPPLETWNKITNNQVNKVCLLLCLLYYALAICDGVKKIS
jgi:hypothetical protein